MKTIKVGEANILQLDWRVTTRATPLLDVRLTFNLETRTAYMTVAWHNNDGNTVDLEGDREIEWNAALRLIEGDVPAHILEKLS